MLCRMCQSHLNEKSSETDNSDEAVKELEAPYVAGGDMNWCSHPGKIRKFHKNLDMELPFDLAIPLLGVYPRMENVSTQQPVYKGQPLSLLGMVAVRRSPDWGHTPGHLCSRTNSH